MGKTFLAGVALLVFTVPALAQSELPAADQVFEKYARAVGGREGYLKLRSRSARGALETDGGASFQVELLAKAPAKFRFEVIIPNFGSVVQAFDGAVAWDSNPQEGVRELTGGTRANRMRNAQFYRDIELRKLYEKATVTGTGKIGELDVYIVEAVPGEGFPDIYYFAVESGLLLKRDSKYETPEGIESFSTFYEDYREVDGIKLPFALRRVGGDSNFTIRFTEITHNVPIEDSRFTKPSTP